MKMSSTLSSRIKIVALSGLFALASACSGDKAPADEELDVSGEEAAAPAAPADAQAEAPTEGEPAAADTTKKSKKGKKGAKKGAKKASAKKPKQK
jgi:hypothetical protein